MSSWQYLARYIALEGIGADYLQEIEHVSMNQRASLVNNTSGLVTGKFQLDKLTSHLIALVRRKWRRLEERQSRILE
jgi:hypothetical protein